MLTELVAMAAAFAIAATLTPWVRRLVVARQIVDYPNARSSHSHPVPRGGGIAIVIAFATSLIVLGMLRVVSAPLVLALTGGGVIIAVVGFMDDRGSLPVGIRIIFHFVAAIWALYVLGDPAPVRIGDIALNAGVLGKVLSAFGIVWTLNLFNFMDGIDGIAASEAVFVAVGGAIVCLMSGTAPSVPLAAFAFAGANLGFLIWNWPPASIFMGDVGSGYVGYCIAVLALAGAHESSTAVASWLTLGGIFFVDATVTLARRLLRGDRVYEAHRTHAYQWLARRWNSHQRVTLAVAIVNVLWLFPCALLTAKYPSWAAWIALCALAPLAAAAVAAGSGRRELVSSI